MLGQNLGLRVSPAWFRDGLGLKVLAEVQLYRLRVKRFGQIATRRPKDRRILANNFFDAVNNLRRQFRIDFNGR